MDNKKLLRNLYLAAKYHAQSSRMRSNDLVRKEDCPEFHWKDGGGADAYEFIIFLLDSPEILENMDYNEIMKVDNRVPNWLKE